MPWLLLSTLIVWIVSMSFVIGAIRARGFVGRVKRLLAAVLWAGLGVALASVLLVSRLFQAFSGETLVAVVTAQPVSPEEFLLTYAPVGEGARHLPVRLRGDQWSISGGIVKWHPWLSAFGIRSYHRPMRLSGQFSDIAKQRSRLPTIYELSPQLDRVWESLYWADARLPFVEAVYGSAAYAYVEPHAVQEVYVTASGYLIKRQGTR